MEEPSSGGQRESFKGFSGTTVGKIFGIMGPSKQLTPGIKLLALLISISLSGGHAGRQVSKGMYFSL